MEWNCRTAWVAVKTNPGAPGWIWDRFLSWEHTLGAWETTGEWDYLIWIDVKDWDELHRWVAEVRGWEGVRYTSSHMVYGAMKNGAWWWSDPWGVWMWGRSGQVEKWRDAVSSGWASGSFSLPGHWDCLFWVQGKDWDEVWGKARHIRDSGWETCIQVPTRKWWNQQKLQSWV